MTKKPILRVGACLSLSGRYSRFGRQAADALRTWSSLDGAAELVIEDDRSDLRRLEAVLPDVARRSDVLLGPYSTQLMRRAGDIGADAGWLVWNHGGSGDDVECAHPGHVVSVLTPTSRYAEPFLQHLADDRDHSMLVIVQGRGSFGRQVADGAAIGAEDLGITTVRVGPDDEIPSLDEGWDLLSAGTYEDDVATVERALDLADPPRLICAVAAGVRDFGDTVRRAHGVFGLGQWFSGMAVTRSQIGPSESDFLAAHSSTPDYPAIQAVAGAVLAAHCARLAGGSSAPLLWSTATELDTSTLFGSFRVDSETGAQLAHRTVLVRWSAQGLAAA
jgi:Periplasmic binding protein